MERKIKIFKSFEEQERYHLSLLAQSTVIERFQVLYKMQKWTQLLHPVSDTTRK